MAIESYNPLEGLGVKFTDGLDYIIAHPPVGDWTFEYLNEVVQEYLNTLDDDGPLGALISTLVPNTVNDYINLRIAQNLSANAAQLALIDAIIEGINTNTIDSLDKFWYAANEQLTLSGIDTIDKTSLYAATTLAKASTAYWNNIVTTPGDWGTFLNANAAINYAKIPAWTTATFVGSLSGYAQLKETDVTQTADMGTFFGIFGAFGGLGSALGLTAGLVIFKWAKRPVVNPTGRVDAMLNPGGCGCGSF